MRTCRKPDICDPIILAAPEAESGYKHEFSRTFHPRRNPAEPLVRAGCDPVLYQARDLCPGFESAGLSRRFDELSDDGDAGMDSGGSLFCLRLRRLWIDGKVAVSQLPGCSADRRRHRDVDDD